MIRNWSMAHRLVTGYGGKFYAFLQPNLYVGAPRKDHVVLKTKQRDRGGEFRTVYPILQRKLDQFGANWWFELTTAFDGNRPIYVDDVHVAPPGNRIIAEKIPTPSMPPTATTPNRTEDQVIAESPPLFSPARLSR
jgi:hypothetical protein